MSSTILCAFHLLFQLHIYPQDSWCQHSPSLTNYSSRLPWKGWSKWAPSSGLASGPDTFCPTALPLEGIAQFSHSVMSDSLQPHDLQHIRLPCPSSTQRVCSNSCPLSWWCYTTVSCSVVPFPSSLQSFPASGWFPTSQFFASGGQSIKASTAASIPPMNIQDWFPSGWTGWISLQSKGLSRVFSKTTVQKHQSFGAQLSL